MQVFLSFHGRDKEAVDRIHAGLAAERPQWELFYSPLSITGGVFWMPRLGEAIAKADVFIFVLGQLPGPYQTLEYYAALDRKAKDGQLPLVPLLLEQSSLPGWPFFNQLNWLDGRDGAGAKTVAEIIQAIESGEADGRPRELWRLVNPYRQLLSLREEDAAFFHGRDELTCEVVERLAARSGKMTMLVGNSGVGKSSVAFAGVFATLHRQSWPGDEQRQRPWPASLANSRRWVRMAMKPGENPVSALASAFTSQWPDPKMSAEERIASLERASVHWEAAFRDGAGIDALVRAADALGKERTGDIPERYVLYLDQGEELYTRARPELAKLFARLLGEAARHDRVSVFGSLRADYFGRLHDDAELRALTERLEVLPPDEAQLRAVIEGPATTLGAAYEPELVDDIVASVLRRQGALPLLSYWLHDRWHDLQTRAAGNVIERPKGEIDIAAALISRADDVLLAHPGEAARNRLRRIFCIHLAFVPEQGEASRRVALREEFDEDEWALVCELAHETRRLVVTGEDEHGRVFAEVAHEALLRSWPTLTHWLADRRDFYAWQSRVEADRKLWEEAGKRKPALLSGAQLDRARGFLEHYPDDVPDADAGFVRASIVSESRRKRIAWGAGLAAALSLVIAVLAFFALWQQSSALALRAQQELESAQRRESLLLAEKARQANDAQDYMRAMLIALEGLPNLSRRYNRPVEPTLHRELYTALPNNRELAVMRGHLSDVLSVSFSPDGKKLASASSDGTAKLWEVTSGKELGVLRHESPVLSVHFSPDGTKLVTASEDRTARVWDPATGNVLTVLKGHEHLEFYKDAWARSGGFSPNGWSIITSGSDFTARLWDTATGIELIVLRGHESSVWSTAFSPDGTKVLTASWDQTARLWGAANGKELAVFRHESSVWFAAFSPDGTRLVTTSGDMTVRLWEIASGKEVGVLRGHKGIVISAAFSPDGTKIVTASADKTARLWDAVSGRELAQLTGHEDGVMSAVFSPDGTKVVTASNDNTIRIWEAEVSDLGVLRGHESGVVAAAFSPDGSKVVTASMDGTARVWDSASGDELSVLRGHEKRLYSVSFSPDGARIATASGDNTARIWDAESGDELVALKGHEGELLGASFRPDGRRLVTVSNDKTARIWDASTGTQLVILRGHEHSVGSAVFSPDGTTLLTSSIDKTARVWDAVTGRELAVLWHQNSVMSAVFSPDGTKVATASEDKTARLWDTATGTELIVLKGHEQAVGPAVFSPNGTKVATSSWEDGTLRLWDAASGRVLVVLTGNVNAGAFSPDGTKLVSVLQDNTARIWQTSSGRELLVLRGHEGYIMSAVFSPDGTKVVTASNDNMARIWKVDYSTQELVDAARAKLTRCLTPKEREELYLPPEARYETDPLYCLH